MILIFFFFNDTATTEIYTLSLHDALPIFGGSAELVLIAEARGDADVVVGHVGEQDLLLLQRALPDQPLAELEEGEDPAQDRKSTRLNSSHANISYAVFCLKKKKYQSR